MDKLPAILLFAAIVFAGIALTLYMQNQELKALLPKPRPSSGGCGCGCASCTDDHSTPNNAPLGGGYTTP